MKRRPKRNFVDNQKLYDEIVAYQKACKIAKIQQKSEPKLNRYLALTLMEIATRFSQRKNFRNYYYIDDMISGALENLIKSVKKFDTERFKNPFAYFTQVVYYAFINYISREKKQMKLRDKVFEYVDDEQMFQMCGDPRLDAEMSQSIRELFQRFKSFDYTT